MEVVPNSSGEGSTCDDEEMSQEFPPITGNCVASYMMVSVSAMASGNKGARIKIYRRIQYTRRLFQFILQNKRVRTKMK